MRHVWLSCELFLSRLNGSQCEDGRNPAGILLIISLTWTYPKPCGSVACREKFDVKVQLHIRSLYNKFSLSIKFMDGRTIDIGLVFCSFQPLPTGKSLIYLKAEMNGVRNILGVGHVTVTKSIVFTYREIQEM